MIIPIINTHCVCIFLLLSLSKEVRGHECQRSKHQAAEQQKAPLVCVFEIFHNAVAQKCFSYQILSPLHQFQSPCTLSSTSSSITHFSARPRKHWRMKTLSLTLGVLNNTLNKQQCGDSVPSWCVNDSGHAACQIDGKMKGQRSL